MGFNKMYLPEVEELKKFLLENGNQKFIERWCVPFQKRDAIIGPEGSIDFIKQFLKQEYNDSRNVNTDLSDSTK
jgi:hypothetical protein